jgi:hypothetical protein
LPAVPLRSIEAETFCIHFLSDFFLVAMTISF